MTESAAQRWHPDQYHLTAQYLFPAAVAAVAETDAGPGELIIDSGTGTGNGAIAAIERGLRVVGVDNSMAQIGAARYRLAGRPATFLVADAQRLPLCTAGAAAAISVFGIIFATDPQQAIAELVRCVRPGGRVVFTCLAPSGWPVVARRALATELGSAAPPFPACWGNSAAAATAASTAGLEAVHASWKPLRFTLDPERSIADQVTSRMGVLAAQREALRVAGRWPFARKRLDDLLAREVRHNGGVQVLMDEYLLVRGTRR